MTEAGGPSIRLLADYYQDVYKRQVYDNANMIFRNTEYYATYEASTYEKIDRLSVQYGIKVRPLAWAFMFPGERCFEGTRAFTLSLIHI